MKDNIICLERYRKEKNKSSDLDLLNSCSLNLESESIDILIDNLSNMIELYERKLQVANKI
ncbi:MAG: hypothetical protein HOJ35_07525 [Bdellovibrionales bacterium]|nr:hypothetical protein [Bdellovibrionales bacterium]